LKTDDLQNLPMALPSERISASQAMGRYFEEQGIVPHVAMTFDDGHALLELVKMGKLVTCLPRWAVRDDPEICALSLPPPGIHFLAGAMWTHLSPASKAFLAVAEQHLKVMKPDGAKLKK